jgi:cold shock CspA family protein
MIMGIFDRMRQTTAGKTTEEIEQLEESNKPAAKHGDVIKGTITQIVHPKPGKKGGYGFIVSPQLPYERIFFHWSGLQQQTLRFPQLKRRMRVELQLQHDPIDGFKGIKIKVLE